MSSFTQLKSVRVVAGMAILVVVALALGLGLGIGLRKTNIREEVKHSSETPSGGQTSLSSFLFVIDGGGSISVIDVATDSVTRSIKLNGSWPHHASMSPDKRKMIVGLPGINLSGGHIMNSMDDGAVHGGEFIVLDSTSFNILKSVKLPQANHNSIFSPDGTEIWTGQMVKNGTVLVYDSTTYVLKTTIRVGLTPLEVSFSHDGLKAFVCNNAMEGTVKVIDVKTKKITSSYSVGMNPVGAWPGVNNKMYVDNVMSQTISIIDATTMKKEAQNIILSFEPGMVAYNPKDNTVWITDETKGNVVIFSNKTAIATINAGPGSHGIIFDPDYTKAYVTNQLADTVSVISTSHKMKMKDIAVGKKPNGMVLK